MLESAASWAVLADWWRWVRGRIIDADHRSDLARFITLEEACRWADVLEEGA